MSRGLLHCVQETVAYNAVYMEIVRDFVGPHWISGLSGFVSGAFNGGSAKNGLGFRVQTLN